MTTLPIASTADPLYRWQPSGNEPGRRLLTVPGLGNSGPDHWQSRWELSLPDCCRVRMGSWDAPSRPDWVAAIDRSVAGVPGSAVLIGHSLGCIAVAWWAVSAAASLVRKVAAAMLVAPPDLGQQGVDLRLMRFMPLPIAPLPFRSMVVASANDQYSTLARSQELADRWGSTFVNIGRHGHINAASALGDWSEGRAALAALTANLHASVNLQGKK